jgi:phage tail protein X
MAGSPLTVSARAGEPLDALVWRTNGSADVEPVLEANPGLAALGAFLPEGTPVLIPETAPAAAAAAQLVQLWD